MANITIRNLNDAVKTRLRVRAAAHHPPMGEEVRIILQDAVNDGRAALLYGVAIVSAGRRRNALEAAMLRWLDTGFAERILPFDSTVPCAYADIAAGRRTAGRPIAPADCQSAAIARSRGMAVVTRNIRDFEDTGIKAVDPWTAA